MTYSSTVPSRGAGFAQALRAEWTKLRSLRSTWICVALTIGLTILLAYLAGSGNTTDANDFGPQRVFSVQLVHQPLTGDGSIVARVADQDETGPDAKAGLMITAPVPAPGERKAATLTRGTPRSWSRPATACSGSPASPTRRPVRATAPRGGSS